MLHLKYGGGIHEMAQQGSVLVTKSATSCVQSMRPPGRRRDQTAEHCLLTSTHNRACMYTTECVLGNMLENHITGKRNLVC